MNITVDTDMMRTAEEVQRKNSTTGADLPVGDADMYDDKD